MLSTGVTGVTGVTIGFGLIGTTAALFSPNPPTVVVNGFTMEGAKVLLDESPRNGVGVKPPAAPGAKPLTGDDENPETAPDAKPLIVPTGCDEVLGAAGV